MRITYKGLRSGNGRCAIITYGENEENKAYEIARKFTISTSYKVDTLIYGMLIIDVDNMNDFNNLKEWYKEFKADNTNDTAKTESDTINTNNDTDNTNNDTDNTNNDTDNTNNDTDSTNNDTTKTESDTNTKLTKYDINKKFGVNCVYYDTSILERSTVYVVFPNTIKLLPKLEKLFAIAEKYKNSYTWHKDNGNTQQREYKEKQDTINEFEWIENGDKYTAKYTVQITRYNVYAYGTYTKNGKKTTLTAIKNSYKRLLQAVKRE